MGAQLHHDVLAAAGRPHLERGTAGQSSCARRGFTGVVIVTGPKNGDPDEAVCAAGPGLCATLVRIARGVRGTSRRIAAPVRRDSQRPKRGVRRRAQPRAGWAAWLVRVIGTEHPHLRVSQIDVDEDTEAEQLARQLLGRPDEDETAWRNGQWYTARLSPAPLRPDERRTTVVDHRRMACVCRSARPVTWRRWN